MSLLSDRQKEDLHKSMLDYLYANNFIAAYNALKQDAETEYTPDPKAKYTGLLEKKWTSVIRLQKKIMDLENRNSALQEELSQAPAKRAASQSDWVPRAPAAHVLTGHRSPITRVAFHPQYSILASASEDATVKIWDWETGEFERTLKGHTKAVMDVDFDHKGQLLVTCSTDLFIKIWDTQNEWKNTKTFPGHEHSVSSVRFMPGDQFIVSASRDRTIRMFDVASTHLVRTISGHSDWVRCVMPSDDGKLLASASNDHTARIWDPLTGESKMELRGHENAVEVVAFAPLAAYAAIRELAGIPNTDRSKRSGAYAATGARDKTIKLWDTASGQLLKNLPGHDNWVRALAFHPSGKYLLSASDDKTIRVWELLTGRCMKTVEAHGHFVQTLAWGRQVVSERRAACGGEADERCCDGERGPDYQDLASLMFGCSGWTGAGTDFFSLLGPIRPPPARPGCPIASPLDWAPAACSRFICFWQFGLLFNSCSLYPGSGRRRVAPTNPPTITLSTSQHTYRNSRRGCYYTKPQRTVSSLLCLTTTTTSRSFNPFTTHPQPPLAVFSPLNFSSLHCSDAYPELTVISSSSVRVNNRGSTYVIYFVRRST